MMLSRLENIGNYVLCFLYCYGNHRHLRVLTHSFPTRRSSDLVGAAPFYRSALVLLATLFFMWGFITVINNTLLPHLRSVFDLNYTQTTLIESVWFIAYFVASIPSAKLIERIGYKN